MVVFVRAFLYVEDFTDKQMIITNFTIPEICNKERFTECKRESLLRVPCWVLATGSPISLEHIFWTNVVGSQWVGGLHFFLRVPYKTHKNNGTPIRFKKRYIKTTKDKRSLGASEQVSLSASWVPLHWRCKGCVSGAQGLWLLPSTQGFHSFLPECGGVFWKRLPWQLLCPGICNVIAAKPQPQSREKSFWRVWSMCGVRFGGGGRDVEDRSFKHMNKSKSFHLV